ncbi:hypothetical protein N9F08_00575 [bacterium]|nr:hypothetical protein [bacterium]
MKKSNLNLKGATLLSMSEKKHITGGVGPYSVRCNSGVWVAQVPNLKPETTAWACSNQGGFSGMSMQVGDINAPSIAP